MNVDPPEPTDERDPLRIPLRDALDREAAAAGAPRATWSEVHQRMTRARRQQRMLYLSAAAAVVVLLAGMVALVQRPGREEPVRTFDRSTTAPARPSTTGAPRSTAPGRTSAPATTQDTAPAPTTGPGTTPYIFPTPHRTPRLHAVQFVSKRTGFAIGSLGTILRTDDGGRTWHHNRTDRASSVSGGGDLRNIDMIDSTHGWIHGPTVDLFTTDGWYWYEASNGAAGKPIYTAHFWNRTDGLGIAATWPAAGEAPTHGVLVRSTDGGRRWDVVPGVPFSVQSVCATGPDDMWAGNANFVWHSTDDGATWAGKLAALEAGQIPDIQCARAGTAWVQYSGGAAATQSVLYELYATQDVGRHWQTVLYNKMSGYRLPAPGGPGTFPGPFSLIDRRTAFVTGRVGGDGPTNGVLAAVDAPLGPTRTIAPFDLPSTGGGTDLGGVSFVDADHGWAVGQVAGRPVIAATTDGGATWSRQYP